MPLGATWYGGGPPPGQKVRTVSLVFYLKDIIALRYNGLFLRDLRFVRRLRKFYTLLFGLYALYLGLLTLLLLVLLRRLGKISYLGRGRGRRKCRGATSVTKDYFRRNRGLSRVERSTSVLALSVKRFGKKLIICAYNDAMYGRHLITIVRNSGLASFVNCDFTRVVNVNQNRTSSVTRDGGQKIGLLSSCGIAYVRVNYHR